MDTPALVMFGDPKIFLSVGGTRSSIYFPGAKQVNVEYSYPIFVRQLYD
jgi:hypothetical protein